MKLKSLSLLLIGLLVSVACQSQPAQTASAVTTAEQSENGVSQGGFIVQSSFSDASTLNPVLADDETSFDVISKLYLALINVDPFSGAVMGEIAERWETSENGLEYTFYLRDDISWSDGTPLTAHDVKFTFDAIGADEVGSSRRFAIQLVSDIAVVNDHTVKFNFSEVDCTALAKLSINILPAHVYAADFSDIINNTENEVPTVVSGPFMFQEWVRDDHVTLVSNPTYYKGPLNVDGWIYRVFADQAAELEATLAGEIDITSVSPQFVSVIKDAIAEGQPFQLQQSLSDGYQYITFNLADPNNAQPGYVDENGNGSFDEGEPPLINDPHPVFGDIAVRKAIAQAIDYPNLIEKVLFGQGRQAHTDVLPAVEWAYNSEIQPYIYDLEAAAATLEAAGWAAPTAGSIRVKDGQPLRFRLMTDAGNEVHENVALIVKDSLEKIGFEVELGIVEWGALLNELTSQSYDAIIIGWSGVGSDPDNSWYWGYRNDDPQGGFNVGSYYNETQEKNLWTARSIPGCNLEERASYYKENQQIVHDELPYIFLYVPLNNVVWNTRLNEINPGPWSTYYNVEEWYISQ